MSGNVQANSLLKWSISCIENERVILSRLIYRNNNQHGKSKIFSHLKALSKILTVLNGETSKSLVVELDSSVRAACQHKQNQVQFLEILSSDLKAHSVTCLSIIGVQHCLKASDCLIKLLSLKVFVPLYSLLLALVARVAKCLSIFAFNFHSRLLALSDQIKHIGIMHDKFSNEVKSFLQTVVLTTEEELSLTNFKTALNLNLDSGNDPTIIINGPIKQKSLSLDDVNKVNEFKTVSYAENNNDDDVGDVIGNFSTSEDINISININDQSMGNIEDDNDDDEHVGYGMTIDSDEEPPKNTTTSGLNIKKRNADEISTSPNRPQTTSLTDSLMINPTSLFKESFQAVVEPTSTVTPVDSVSSKNVFKKKKTLKALKRKEERAGKEKSKAEKDDIDDIFGGL